MKDTKGSFGGQKETDPSYISRLLRLPRGIERLEMYGEKKFFPKNHVLVSQGKKTKYAYIVKRGRVLGHEYTPSGDELVYNFNEGNSILLEMNVLFGWECPVEFKTTVDSELVCVTRESLLNAIMGDPDIALDIIQSISLKFMSSMDQIRQMNYHSAEWRICNLFLIFAEQFGTLYDGKMLLREKISQQMIASLLGINRVTAVRAIKGLKDMGLIEQINGYYCIRDTEKLKRHLDRLIR